MSYTYGSKNIDPLEDAVISFSLKPAKNNIWVVNMKATCKGWIPTQEQFPIKLDETLEQIS